MDTASRASDSSRRAFTLAAFMLVAGLAHFAVPRTYERIVPRLMGDPAFWVRWSGVAEIVCAGLLVGRRTRRAGAIATVGVLLAVFPANVKMALDGGIPGRPFPLGSPVAAWARLLLQMPLILWARRVAASARGRGTGGQGVTARSCSGPPASRSRRSEWRRTRG